MTLPVSKPRLTLRLTSFPQYQKVSTMTTRTYLWIILCYPVVTSITREGTFPWDFGDGYIQRTNVVKVSSDASLDINTSRTSAAAPDADEATTTRNPVVASQMTADGPSYVPITLPVGDFTASISVYGNPTIPSADANSLQDYNDGEIETSRYRRSLTFPDPSTILLIFGLGTPLQLDRESIIIGAFTKMIYNLPLNSTDFTESGIPFSRTKSRWSLYRILEKTAELYGFGAGKGCLLRAVCEIAAAPFDLRHGLFGQMVQAFFTPSSTIEPYDEYSDREYHSAERLGRNVNEKCHALYPECERSILDVFSTTRMMTTGEKDIENHNPID